MIACVVERQLWKRSPLARAPGELHDGPGAKLEVRRVTGPEDFPADNEWVQKEEGWREEQAARKAADAPGGVAG